MRELFRFVEMRYQPERALTHIPNGIFFRRFDVEMRYQPERALTHSISPFRERLLFIVEMRYQPERALTQLKIYSITSNLKSSRNEVSAREGIDTHVDDIHYLCYTWVEMRYQPERALTLLATTCPCLF